MPAVAIVIPAYNAARTLEATLNALRAQTLTDFEAVIVNDGSTDDTLKIASAMARADQRFKVISQANGGVADARNAGIANTTAEFIASLDADDLWHPTFLEKLRTALAATPDTVLAYANTRIVDMAGRVLRNAPPSQHCGRVYEALVLRNFIGNGSAMMFKREPALRVGGYERRLRHECGAEGSEDWLLSMRLAARGRVAVVREYLVGYRATDGAMSQNVLRTRRSRLHALLSLAQENAGSSLETRRRALGRAHGKCFLREVLAGEFVQASHSLALALKIDWVATCHLFVGPPRWRWLGERLWGVRQAREPRAFFELDPRDRSPAPDHSTDEPHWWNLDASADADDTAEIVIAAVARGVHPK